MTPPLLAIPHDWVRHVQHVRTWPTDVLPTRNGREQRLARSVRPRETLRYLLTLETVEEGAAVFGAHVQAAHAASAPLRRQVRVPRWEDATLLVVDAESGADQLVLWAGPGDNATHRRFANGGAVALWRPGHPVGVATLAAADAITADTLTLAEGLAEPWAAGTRVAPLATGRVASDVAWERITGTVGQVALEVVLDDDVAGLTAAVEGAPGSAQLPTIVSLALTNEDGGNVAIDPGGAQRRLLVTARDALGALVPVPNSLVWSLGSPTVLTLRVPDASPAAPLVGGPVAYLGFEPGAGGSPRVDVEDPVTGLSAFYVVIGG
ncbi:hypothetical protein [Roseisolibacter agri]|uniref:Uncharacterized protein n=1 Tax=Roseisolibacter agri TaxID=2014610 RepID=A0AA37V6A1_9BACT|nr:hypothetical protein [Roseisolibacter agri]GLC25061.1 hypothetical protein rosag_15740 [Roseisolibacter agri]